VYYSAVDIKVGDIVVPRLTRGTRHLFLWRELNEADDESIVVDRRELLTVVQVRYFNHDEQHNLQPEWQKSACMLLRSTGEMGWVGSGWIQSITI
jgi:hypothetical protein